MYAIVQLDIVIVIIPLPLRFLRKIPEDEAALSSTRWY